MKRAALLVPLALLGLGLGGCARPHEDRPWVRRLKLRGVRNVDRNVLMRGLASKPTPWYRRGPVHVFDELELEQDRARIQRYYEQHGYFAAKVVLAEARPRPHGSGVDVMLRVAEGTPTYVGDVRLFGVGEIDLETMREVHEHQLGLRRGQVFHHADYLQFKDGILSALKRHGYAWAELDGTVTIEPKKNLANVVVTVKPGTIQNIGRIRFEGAGGNVGPEVPGLTPKDTLRLQRSAAAARTVDERLLGKVYGLTEGEQFDISRLELARARVLELGIFSSVGHAYRKAGEPGRVDVELRLANASLHEFRVGGGIGIEAQRSDIRIQLDYTKRNFWGGLRTFELRLQPAYVVVPALWSTIERHGVAGNADAIFSQPRLGYLSRLQASIGYDLGLEYAFRYHGPRANLSFLRLLWHDRISVALAYNFQFLQFFETSPQITAEPALAASRYGYADLYRVAWFQEELRFDWRDSRIDPHKGMFAEAVLEHGGQYTGSAFTYEKLRIGQRGYLPLGSRVVLANRIEFAQMWSHGDESSPITRRLALGGPLSHRGFAEGRLAPQLPSVNGSPIPVGGEQSLLMSVEVRVDTFRFLGNLLTAAAFLDVGDVGAARGHPIVGSQEHIYYKKPHAALGFGLRYRTAIGLVRTDVGVRLNRLSATEDDGTPNPDPGQRVAFHISLSEGF